MLHWGRGELGISKLPTSLTMKSMSDRKIKFIKQQIRE